MNYDLLDQQYKSTIMLAQKFSGEKSFSNLNTKDSPQNVCHIWYISGHCTVDDVTVGREG